MASIKKDYIGEETTSIYTDDTTLLNYNYLNPCNNNNNNKSNIPRYFNLSNLKKLLNNPYKNSRRLNPCLYHSFNNNSNYTNTDSNIYHSYIQYEEELSHRNKLPSQSSENEQQHNELLLLNEQMIKQFWIEDTMPNETDFDLSSDEEEDTDHI